MKDTDDLKHHYDALLAEHYTWLFGGLENNVQRFMELFRNLGLESEGNGTAIDLGAGSGFQSLALARLGYRVTAIDLNTRLLEELQVSAAEVPVQTLAADMRDAGNYPQFPVDLVVCMGDTLAHLPEHSELEGFLGGIAAALKPGGKCVFSFRDMSQAPAGPARFIPVRSDNNRIFTCFIEAFEDHLMVHDLLHERDGEAWNFRCSAYRKLRLSREEILTAMQAAGLTVVRVDDKGGMVTVLGGAS